MFFGALHAPMITAKLLKLRDPSRGLAPMPKLAFEKTICSMHKIISLSFIPGYGPIYRQKCGIKPQLGFLLHLTMEFDLAWKSYPDSTYSRTVDQILQGVLIGPGL
jgi:hypothetical protein